MLDLKNIKILVKLREENDDDKHLIQSILDLLNKIEDIQCRKITIRRYKIFLRQNRLIPGSISYIEQLLKPLIDEVERLNQIIQKEKYKPPKKISLKTIKKILEFKNSSKPEELLTYLIFISGMRRSEIFNLKPGEAKWLIDINEPEFYKLKLALNNMLELKGSKHCSIVKIEPIESTLDLKRLYVDFHKKYSSISNIEDPKTITNRILNHHSYGPCAYYKTHFEILEPMDIEEFKLLNRKKMLIILKKNEIYATAYMPKSKLIELGQEHQLFVSWI